MRGQCLKLCEICESQKCSKSYGKPSPSLNSPFLANNIQRKQTITIMQTKTNCFAILFPLAAPLWEMIIVVLWTFLFQFFWNVFWTSGQSSVCVWKSSSSSKNVDQAICPALHKFRTPARPSNMESPTAFHGETFSRLLTICPEQDASEATKSKWRVPRMCLDSPERPPGP